jgi:cyanophycin synthetase
VLEQAGLPGPRHLRVATPDQALEAATRLGYPVVVKPRDLDQGLGVAANLHSAAEVAEAFETARSHSPNVLVEKHFSGNDYRLTVFEGRLIKATLRVPGGVHGDGVHSVEVLVERAQQDRQQARRARERGRPLLTLDAEALGLLTQAGLSPRSVPAGGSYVPLRRRANLSADGTSIAVELQDVHPDNRRLAERAAQALRLDLAGIDLLIPDIGQSWLQTGALICEVNAQPQIGIGTSPHIYEDILLELVGKQTRIPLLLVLANGRPADLPWLYRHHPGSKCLGLSSRWGISEQGLSVTTTLRDDWVAGQALLNSSSVEMGIIVMDAREVRRTGLPSDLFEAVLLADTPGNREISTSGWSNLWQLLLPHVRRGLLAPEAMRPALPAAPALSQHNLSAFVGTDSAHCLAQGLNWLNTTTE